MKIKKRYHLYKNYKSNMSSKWNLLGNQFLYRMKSMCILTGELYPKVKAWKYHFSDLKLLKNQVFKMKESETYFTGPRKIKLSLSRLNLHTEGNNLTELLTQSRVWIKSLDQIRKRMIYSIRSNLIKTSLNEIPWLIIVLKVLNMF